LIDGNHQWLLLDGSTSNARAIPLRAGDRRRGWADQRAAQPDHRFAQGGGGGSGYYANTTVRTDLDPAAIGTHYAAQLRDAGWTAQGEGHAGPVAWSAWTFRDGDGEEWRGLLFALRRPEVDGDYVVYLRADANAGDATSGGWTSSTISARK